MVAVKLLFKGGCQLLQISQPSLLPSISEDGGIASEVHVLMHQKELSENDEDRVREGRIDGLTN
jgi:hypothetical protein